MKDFRTDKFSPEDKQKSWEFFPGGNAPGLQQGGEKK